MQFTIENLEESKLDVNEENKSDEKSEDEEEANAF